MSGGKIGRKALKEYLLSYITSILICFIILIISCAIIISTKDPDSLYRKASYTAMTFASLCSGFAAVKITKKSISGIIIGILLSLTFAVVSLIFFERTTDIGTSLLLHLAVVLLASAGGFIGKRKNRSRRKIRKQIKRKK